MNINNTGYFNNSKDYLVFFAGLIAVIYLLNFSFGFLEFLPDTLPVIGHVDEALAGWLLYSSLVYFGIEIKTLFNPKKQEGKEESSEE